MSSSARSFDPIGVVIDWLDACRERRFGDLLDLYAEQATLDCCDGARFVGRGDLVRYWQVKLRAATAGAFGLDEVRPDGDCVRLDYRDYDGSAVSTKFWFDDAGNITRTLCVPVGPGRAESEAA